MNLNDLVWKATTVAIIAICSALLPDRANAQIRPTPDEARERAKATFGPPPSFQQLSRDELLWANKKRQMVIMDGFVTLRTGQLEMFACPVGSKEHESIVAVFAQPSWVHAALVAIDAKVGTPVKFIPPEDPDDEFVVEPPTGSTIKIYVLWYDPNGKKKMASAQDWIINVQTKQKMNLDWVFAGSKFVVSEYDQKEYYQGDSGDFITVANFQSATLDVAARSDSDNSSLQFVPATDEIPELFTPVRMVLQVSDDTPRQ